MINRFIIILLLIGNCLIAEAFANYGDSSKIIIRKTADFKVSGEGKAPAWTNAEWTMIPAQESSGKSLSTRAKILYSDLGIYFLFHCDDRKLTATMKKDNDALWREDVVEVFLWPDQSIPVYFEYEISPLNYELPIMVPNLNGKFHGWLPWHYEGDRRVEHATGVQGGEKKSHASIKSWTAEFFIPFKLLRPIVNASPKSGDEWRGNLYRIDYDETPDTAWEWQKTDPKLEAGFHDFKNFGTLVFE